MKNKDVLMKKILIAIFVCSMTAFAAIGLPLVCDVGDARTDSFGKANDYFFIKECVEGVQRELSVNEYISRVYWCSCYAGAMACYFGRDYKKLKKASRIEYEKADDSATKLANQCYKNMK